MVGVHLLDFTSLQTLFKLHGHACPILITMSIFGASQNFITLPSFMCWCITVSETHEYEHFERKLTQCHLFFNQV